MADMTVLYDKRTADLGFQLIKCYTTRLREDVERLIPDIISVKIDLGWSLVFDNDFNKAFLEMKEKHVHCCLYYPEGSWNPLTRVSSHQEWFY